MAHYRLRWEEIIEELEGGKNQLKGFARKHGLSYMALWSSIRRSNAPILKQMAEFYQATGATPNEQLELVDDETKENENNE